MHIETLDLMFQNQPKAIAAFLLFGPEGPVLIETGPGSTLPTLLERLAEQGVQPAEIRHVLLTHIHLDHAGAAGWWASQGATIYVHPAGAPHLIDPSRLLASAGRIYGDAMDRLWGEFLPVPVDRLVALEDGRTVQAAGLRITAVETPGHARHHHVYLLDDIAFSGDAAGILLPEAGWLDLPAPPPEFDVELWKDTLEKLRSRDLRTIYRTHFGPSDNVAYELDSLERLLDETVSFVRQMIDDGLDRSAMVDRYVDWLLQRSESLGIDQTTARAYELANPRPMSVDGITRYWKKRYQP